MFMDVHGDSFQVGTRPLLTEKEGLILDKHETYNQNGGYPHSCRQPFTFTASQWRYWDTECYDM